jgi:hypothetical protein
MLEYDKLRWQDKSTHDYMVMHESKIGSNKCNLKCEHFPAQVICHMF